MSRLLLVLCVVGLQLMLMSCSSQRVALTPLTEPERQGLGTIGIAAEVSRLETQYSRDPSIIDDGLRAMQDRLSDAGQGAINGAKRVYLDRLGDISCGGGQSPATACLGTMLVGILFKGVVMTGGAIAGGVVGALNRETYSNPPLMDLPERSVIHAVQQSIDAFGFPDRLRDHVWEKALSYQTYHFELVPHLPTVPQKTREESPRDNGALYWLLRDKGIQTLFKVRIPLIEFRGSDPEDAFQLFVHVETTLLNINDQACIRHRTWEFEGGSHPIDEWRNNDAKLLIDELDRGLPFIAQHVTSTLFERPSWFSFGASSPVTLQSESLACPG